MGQTWVNKFTSNEKVGQALEDQASLDALEQDENRDFPIQTNFVIVQRLDLGVDKLQAVTIGRGVDPEPGLVERETGVTPFKHEHRQRLLVGVRVPAVEQALLGSDEVASHCDMLRQCRVCHLHARADDVGDAHVPGALGEVRRDVARRDVVIDTLEGQTFERKRLDGHLATITIAVSNSIDQFESRPGVRGGKRINRFR